MARRLLCALCLLLMSGWTALAEPATTPSTAPAADVVAVRRGTIRQTISSAGTFEPVDPLEVRVRTKAYQGELVVVSAAAPGAQLAVDDVVLDLDKTSIRRQIEAAKNELAAAKANFDKAQADIALGDAADKLALTMQEEEVKNAEAALKWWEEVDGQQMVRNAELGAQGAKDAVEDQEDELDQLKKMYKSEELTNATADIVVKRALRALERSRISATMAAARTEKVKENDYNVMHVRMQRNVEQHRQALDHLKVQQTQTSILRQTGQVGAKLALEAVEEKVDNLNKDLEQFTIKTPQSATILYGQITDGAWQNASAKPLRAGDKIAPQAIVMTGYTPGKLRVVADVPEAKMLLVSAGMSATVTPNALPNETLKGKCAMPGVAPLPSTGFPVRIDLDGSPKQLQPGMKAVVTIDAGQAENVLLIPVGAVKEKKVTLRASDGSEKTVEVTLGRNDGESVEVVSGLNQGDTILKAAKN